MRRQLAWIILALLAAGCAGRYPVGEPPTPTVAPTRVDQNETSTAVWATYNPDAHLPTPTPHGTLPQTPAVTVDAFMMTSPIAITVDAFMLTEMTLPPSLTSSPTKQTLPTPTPVIEESPTLQPTQAATVTSAASLTAALTSTPAFTATSPMTATQVASATDVPTNPIHPSAISTTATLSDADLFDHQGTLVAQASTPTLVTGQPPVRMPTISLSPTSTLRPFAPSVTAAPMLSASPVQDLSRRPISATPLRGVSTAVGQGGSTVAAVPKSTSPGSTPVEVMPQLDVNKLKDLATQWVQNLPSIPPPPPLQMADWPVYTQTGADTGRTINPAAPCSNCAIDRWPYDWSYMPPRMNPGLAAALIKDGKLPVLYFKTTYPGSDMVTLWAETIDGVSATTIVPGKGAFQGTPCFNPKQCLK